MLTAFLADFDSLTQLLDILRCTTYPRTALAHVGPYGVCGFMGLIDAQKSNPPPSARRFSARGQPDLISSTTHAGPSQHPPGIRRHVAPHAKVDRIDGLEKL
jgi:hypothetical protein